MRNGEKITSTEGNTQKRQNVNKVNFSVCINEMKSVEVGGGVNGPKLEIKKVTPLDRCSWS